MEPMVYICTYIDNLGKETLVGVAHNVSVAEELCIEYWETKESTGRLKQGCSIGYEIIPSNVCIDHDTLEWFQVRADY